MKKLIAIFAFACSCNPSVSDQDVLDSMQASYFDTGSIWSKNKITACYLDPKPEHAEYRKLVQKAVYRNWDAYIKPDFVWTDVPCEGQEDIRIRIADERPYAVFGVWKRIHLPWVPNIILNFEFNSWGDVCKETEAKRQRCIMKHAVHEFGHSLGFVHEQNRPDTPKSCRDRLNESDFDGLKGNYMSRLWDDRSVMNYCSVNRETSYEDVATAVRFYGEDDEID